MPLYETEQEVWLTFNMYSGEVLFTKRSTETANGTCYRTSLLATKSYGFGTSGRFFLIKKSRSFVLLETKDSKIDSTARRNRRAYIERRSFRIACRILRVQFDVYNT
jgi:hypothetical protein